MSVINKLTKPWNLHLEIQHVEHFFFHSARFVWLLKHEVILSTKYYFFGKNDYLRLHKWNNILSTSVPFCEMLCEKRIQLNVNYLSVLANTTSVPSRIFTLSNATSSTQLEPWRGLLASVILAVKLGLYKRWKCQKEGRHTDRRQNATKIPRALT